MRENSISSPSAMSARAASAAEIAQLAERLSVPQPFLQRQAAAALLAAAKTHHQLSSSSAPSSSGAGSLPHHQSASAAVAASPAFLALLRGVARAPPAASAACCAALVALLSARAVTAQTLARECTGAASAAQCRALASPLLALSAFVRLTAAVLLAEVRVARPVAAVSVVSQQQLLPPLILYPPGERVTHPLTALLEQRPDAWTDVNAVVFELLTGAFPLADPHSSAASAPSSDSAQYCSPSDGLSAVFAFVECALTAQTGAAIAFRSFLHTTATHAVHRLVVRCQYFSTYCL